MERAPPDPLLSTALTSLSIKGASQTSLCPTTSYITLKSHFVVPTDGLLSQGPMQREGTVPPFAWGGLRTETRDCPRGIGLLALHSSWHHMQNSGLEFARLCFDLPIQNNQCWQIRGWGSSAAITTRVVLREMPPELSELTHIPGNIYAKMCIIRHHIKSPGRTLMDLGVTLVIVLNFWSWLMWDKRRWCDEGINIYAAEVPRLFSGQPFYCVLS